jgi:hypothetical protein
MSSRNMCLLPRATLHSDSEQSCTDILPGSIAPASCPGCIVQAVLSCYSVMAVLPQLPSPGCPSPAVLPMVSYSSDPVLSFLSQLTSPPILSRLSSPCILVHSFTVPPVLTLLPCSDHLLFQLSSPGCPVPAILSPTLLSPCPKFSAIF